MPDRGPDADEAAPSSFAPADVAVSAGGTGSEDGDAPIELASEPFALSDSDAAEDESAEAPARRSRVRRIVLSALLLLALAGLAVLGWATWQIASEKDATVTTPSQIADLRLDDSQDGRDTADYLQTALAAEVDLDKAVGAVYTDNGQGDVLFFGGTALIWSPGADLDTAFGLISDDQGAVTGIHAVPAGKLGGTMRCGTTKTPDGAMSVCGWADHGSLALAMFPHRGEKESAALLLQIRDAAQSRR
jgi:hypothetical protein